jgi:hypothetical protein
VALCGAKCSVLVLSLVIWPSINPCLTEQSKGNVTSMVGWPIKEGGVFVHPCILKLYCYTAYLWYIYSVRVCCTPFTHPNISGMMHGCIVMLNAERQSFVTTSACEAAYMTDSGELKELYKVGD